VYCMLTSDYPWMTTEPGQCKCFDYVRQHGFRKYAQKRILPTRKSVAETLSEPAMRMLEGLLSLEPAKRSTLGEKAWQVEKGARRSVLDEEWLREGVDGAADGIPCQSSAC
jgi:hypothetical protein